MAYYCLLLIFFVELVLVFIVLHYTVNEIKRNKAKKPEATGEPNPDVPPPNAGEPNPDVPPPINGEPKPDVPPPK